MQQKSTHKISPQQLRTEIDKIASLNYMFKYGVADLAPILERYPNILENVENIPVTRAYVMAIALQRGVLETIKGKPNALYMHHYRQINYKLDRTALEVATHIESYGYMAVAIGASQTVSKKPMRGHISHRLLASWAGLGWRGRNNLLVTYEHGAQQRLITVLTNAPLLADKPMLYSDCGSCRACVDVCPARALPKRCEDFNLGACSRKLVEHTHLPYVSHHICGVCQKACVSKLDSEGNLRRKNV